MGTDGFTRTGMTRPPSMPISAFSCRLFFFTQSSEKIWIQVRRNEVIKGISGFTLATLRQARHSSKTLNSKSRDGGRRTGLTLPRWTSRTLEAQWARSYPLPASYRECSCKLHHFLPTTRPPEDRQVRLGILPWGHLLYLIYLYWIGLFFTVSVQLSSVAYWFRCFSSHFIFTSVYLLLLYLAASLLPHGERTAVVVRLSAHDSCMSRSHDQSITTQFILWNYTTY